jgi:hypothetical protein
MGDRQRSSKVGDKSTFKRDIVVFNEAIFRGVVGILFQAFLSHANLIDVASGSGCLPQTVHRTPKQGKVRMRTRVYSHVHAVHT